MSVKTWYFGFCLRNERTHEGYSSKLQIKAALLGAAVTDALGDIRRSFNNGLKVYHGDQVTCELTDLEMQKSGWYQCTLRDNWTPQT